MKAVILKCGPVGYLVLVLRAALVILLFPADKDTIKLLPFVEL